MVGSMNDRGLEGLERVGGFVMIAGIAAYGGMMPEAQVAVSALWMVLLAAQSVERFRRRRTVRWTLASLMLLAFAGITLLRAGPLGAPFAGELERAAFATWPQLSLRGTLSPGAAPFRAWTLLGLACAVQFWASTSPRSEDATRGWAMWGLAIVATIGLTHGFLGLDKLYAFYEPHHAGFLFQPFAAPFLNPNQAGAALMLLAALFAYKAVNAHSPSARFPLFAVFALITAYVLVILEARTAALGAAVGGVVASLAFVPDYAWTRTRARAAVAVTLALWALCAWGIWYLVADVAGDWAAKSLRWQEIIGMSLDRPLFGWGAGSLGDASAATFGERYSHRQECAESVPIGIAFEYGLPAVLVVLYAAGRLTWKNVAEAKVEHLPARFAELGVATAIVIEAIGGMGLLSTGYAVVVALVAAPWFRAERSRRPARWDVLGPAAALVVAIAALPGLVASTAYGGTELRRPLEELAAEHGWGSEEVHAEAHELAALVPGSPRLQRAWAIDAIRSANAAQAQGARSYLEERLPGWRLTWDVVFDVRMLEGDRDAACQAIARLAGMDRVRPAVLAAAMLSWSEGDIRRVEPCIGDDPQAWGRAYSALGRTDEDARMLTLATQRHARRPDEPETLRVLVTSYQRLGVPALAKEASLRLIATGEADARDVLALAQSEERLGEVEAARVALDHARSFGDRTCEVYARRLGFAERHPAQTTLATAREDLERARRACTGEAHNRLRVARAAARYFYTEGVFETAERQAYRWLALSVDDPHALRLLGDIARAQGQRSRATGFDVRAAQAEESRAR